MKCADVLDRASEARVLVVGDICLDRWCRYDPALAEPSRETGIPRVAVTRTTVTPGAGGTVAANLVALGTGQVSVLGVIGKDGHARELRRALAERGIEAGLLIETDAVQTFTYTKLINDPTGTEDLPRIDFVNTRPLPPTIDEQLTEHFLKAATNFDAVIVADQAETDQGGIVTARLRRAIGETARKDVGTVVVDSRRRVHHFRHVIATPNADEAAAACRHAFGEVDYRRLHDRIGGPALVISEGSAGARLVSESGERLLGACAAGQPVDTCGAGDSLTAGLALALVTGARMEAALRFGIIVAGVTVTKPGTGTASPAEVLTVEGSTFEGR